MLREHRTLMDAKAEAISAYCVARIAGNDPDTSAQKAWLSARHVLRNLRAPYWYEQILHNTANKRSYCSPLGCVLGVGASEYGSHSAQFPRTVRSYTAKYYNEQKILNYLESYLEKITQTASFDPVNELYK